MEAHLAQARAHGLVVVAQVRYTVLLCIQVIYAGRSSSWPGCATPPAGYAYTPRVIAQHRQPAAEVQVNF